MFLEILFEDKFLWVVFVFFIRVVIFVFEVVIGRRFMVVSIEKWLLILLGIINVF